MKKIINYEKDILFKTNIGEICSISLEHDFTVDDGVLRGEFLITGDYKPNELSVNTEPFDFHLPLEYELEPTVDISTLSYDIDNFEYTTKDDTLSVYIDFGVRYEEKEIVPTIPDVGIEEAELNAPLVEESLLRTESIEEQEPVIEKMEEQEGQEDREILNESETAAILETSEKEDEYITYHVHIVRENDTLESIAQEYGTTIEVIKEYNQCEKLEVKSKLIIPESKDE